MYRLGSSFNGLLLQIIQQDPGLKRLRIVVLPPVYRLKQIKLQLEEKIIIEKEDNFSPIQSSILLSFLTLAVTPLITLTISIPGMAITLTAAFFSKDFLSKDEAEDFLKSIVNDLFPSLIDQCLDFLTSEYLLFVGGSIILLIIGVYSMHRTRIGRLAFLNRHLTIVNLLISKKEQ